MAAKDDYLIDTLIEMGLLMSSDIESARAEADSTGEGVIDTLVKQGVIASSQVATAKAAQLGVEFIPLGEMKIADDAIAAVPTMLAGIWGMNFTHMPEIDEVWGYPAVLVLMVIACIVLYRRFSGDRQNKRADVASAWLDAHRDQVDALIAS